MKYVEAELSLCMYLLKYGKNKLYVCYFICNNFDDMLLRNFLEVNQLRHFVNANM